jgi:hypothetical protein
VLPLSWELVEICRVLPSATVAVMVTEAALVVCQVNVNVWPEVMLLLLAEKTRVGADVIRELAELEPQPVKAMSGEIAANPNRMFKHVASGPILLRIDDEMCRSWLPLRILLPPPEPAACNISLFRRGFTKASILMATALRPFSIHFRFPKKRQAGQAAARTKLLGF